MTTALPLSRRSLLALGGAAAAGFSLPRMAIAQSMPVVSTALGWIPNAEYAGLWVAIEKGYFAEEGIEIAYTPGGPNAPGVLVRLAAGQADFAGGDWIPLFETLNRDNDFVVLGAAFPANPAALMSLSANPVLTPADLVGKRILSQMPADKNTIDFILTKAGLPLDYEMVPTGFSPEPLLAGDGDVYMAFATNQPITFEKMGMVAGQDFHVTLLRDLGYDVPAGPIVAKRDYVAQNRPLVVGYLRALLRGWIENGANPAYGAELGATKYGVDFGLDLDQQIRQSELGQPLTAVAGAPGPFWFDPALYETNILPVAAAAGLTGLPAASDLIDLGPLEEAIASL
ncbi:ABC transporter substrate-binding protein [Ketogulonicigenium vulgare]|nr:ABC transporter substrate-binding protein [Ketogulonicigenium vulgare]